MSTISLPEPMFDLAECAAIIGVKRTSIYRFVYDGRLPVQYNTNGEMRVRKEDLYHYLKNREEK